MAEFWEEWGALAYAFAALWAFFEGETFVLAASAIGAATGLIDPWILMVSVWGGSFAGDQTWFTLGRKCGPAALRRFPAPEHEQLCALCRAFARRREIVGGGHDVPVRAQRPSHHASYVRLVIDHQHAHGPVFTLLRQRCRDDRRRAKGIALASPAT